MLKNAPPIVTFIDSSITGQYAGMSLLYRVEVSMPVDLMKVCRWQANRGNDVVEHPTWDAIETAIRTLNNNDQDDLYLYLDAGDEETFLGVCGGDGRYFVSGSDDAGYPTLLDESKDESEMEDIVIGGQDSEVPANQIVDLSAALAAARDFYDAGGFTGKAKWHYI